jgi:hypothetical protein
MFERYRTLGCSFTSSVISRNSSALKIHTTLSIVMFFSFVFSIPRIYEYIVSYNEIEKSYSIHGSVLTKSTFYIIGYRIFGSLVFYSAVPYFLIFIMSFKIWNKISIASQIREQMNVFSSSQNTSEKIFIAITIKFLISRFGTISFDIIEHIIGTETFEASSLAMLFVSINNLFVVASSALNFFIFWIFLKPFKKEVSNFCSCIVFFENEK